jgi:hypothetical protein
MIDIRECEKKGLISIKVVVVTTVKPESEEPTHKTFFHQPAFPNMNFLLDCARSPKDTLTARKGGPKWLSSMSDLPNSINFDNGGSCRDIPESMRQGCFIM